MAVFLKDVRLGGEDKHSSGFQELLLSFCSGLIQSGTEGKCSLIGGAPVDPRREWQGVMGHRLLAPGSLH